MQRVYPIFRIKIAKIDTLFMTKMAEKTYLWEPHIPVKPMNIHVRENPPGIKVHMLYNDFVRK